MPVPHASVTVLITGFDSQDGLHDSLMVYSVTEFSLGQCSAH